MDGVLHDVRTITATNWSQQMPELDTVTMITRVRSDLALSHRWMYGT